MLRSDGEPEVEAERHGFRRAALARDVPVFDELPDAAGALAAVATLERFLAGADGNDPGMRTSC